MAAATASVPPAANATVLRTLVPLRSVARGPDALSRVRRYFTNVAATGTPPFHVTVSTPASPVVLPPTNCPRQRVSAGEVWLHVNWPVLGRKRPPATNVALRMSRLPVNVAVTLVN